MTSLSLCMIVKNEEDCLSRCLNSVKDIVDEIIIVDTGSTDSTIDIAKSFDSKVFEIKWQDDFSYARNYSFSKASCEWMLIMDADDELKKEDKSKIKPLLNQHKVDVYYFRTISYVGKTPNHNLVSNLNPRLIRNNNKYRFEGRIHEQIRYERKKIPKGKMKSINITIYHYGYLNKNIDKKKKRKRNIKILKQVLSCDKNKAFNLFNMGNEYFALQNFSTALAYYLKSYNNFNKNLGYSPKLLIRIIMCYDELQKYYEEMKMIDTSLLYFPECTDLVYLKACLFHKQDKITLAIDHFKKCLDMGKPPMHQSFIMGVESFRSSFALAEIYYNISDYDKAYSYYIKTIEYKQDFILPLHKISNIFIKKGYDISFIRNRIESFFDDCYCYSSLITLADIFSRLKKYNTAYEYIKLAEKCNCEINKTKYFKAMILFNQKKYSEAKEIYKKISGDFYNNALYKLVLCEIFTNNTNEAINYLNEIEDSDTAKSIIYNKFVDILLQKNVDIITDNKEESESYIDPIFNLLKIIMEASYPDIFESSLKLLNLINNDLVLLKLAKLYYNYGYYKLAYDELLRSIKLFEKIDLEGINILKKIYITTKL